MTYEQQKKEYDTILSIDKILGRNRKTYEADLNKLKTKRKNACKKDGTELCHDPEHNVPCGTCVLWGCKQTGIEEYKPQAYLTLSNHGGITIQVSKDGEGVRYQWYDEKPSTRWLPIKYTSSGRAYFNALKRKFYLDEFMKIGWI